MPYDPADTRRRILAAAVDEFAMHGVAGARMDRIARKARANKESIYRYYGSKQELLRRVLEQYMTDDEEAIRPTASRLEDYPASLFRQYRSSPEYLRLSLWEGLELGGELDEFTLAERTGHYEEKIEAVRAAQLTGIVDPDLDPRHLMIVLLGMANYWFAVPQVVRLLFGREPDEQILAEHEEFLVECTRRLFHRGVDGGRSGHAEPPDAGGTGGRAGPAERAG